MRKKVSPTRHELFRLKRRLELATRGHKLLKDKLEALVRELLPLIPEYNRLVKEVAEKLARAWAGSPSPTPPPRRAPSRPPSGRTSGPSTSPTSASGTWASTCRNSAR